MNGITVVPSASAAVDVERDSRALLGVSMMAMESAGLDLRPLALRALLAIEEIAPCTVGDLAWRLSLSPSATSRLVDRLAGADLVDRHGAIDDRRKVILSSTPAGRRVVGRLVRRRRTALAQILRAMDPVSRMQLAAGLAGFAAAARTVRPQSGGPTPARPAPTRTSA